MESWVKRLPIQLPLKITTRQFVIALTVISVAAFILTYLGVEYVANPIGYLIVLGIQIIMLFNAFIPHIAMTIRFRIYSPGVVTAILLMLPFSFYLLQRAFAENLLTWKQFWILLGSAPFAVAMTVLLSLRIGNAFDKHLA